MKIDVEAVFAPLFDMIGPQIIQWRDDSALAIQLGKWLNINDSVFKRYKNGGNSYVLSHIDYPGVLFKLGFNLADAWLDYYDFCQHHESDHLMKFYSDVYEYENLGVYIVAMEELSDGHADGLPPAIHNHQLNGVAYRLSAAYNTDNLKEWMLSNDFNLEYLEFYKLMVKLVRGYRRKPDIVTGGNLLYRDETIVMVDPIQ